MPSLLVQLEAFAAGRRRGIVISELGLKPADALSEDERAFCVEQFFHAHRPRMIDPFPRYAELLARAEANGNGLSARAQAARSPPTTCATCRSGTSWCGSTPTYFERDPRVRALFAKGRDFTEEDKPTLRAVELEILRRVVPEYREAARRGQVELSTSPFYHPILPLLCDTRRLPAHAPHRGCRASAFADPRTRPSS